MRDERESSKVEHRMLDMLRQRVYALAAGYEDINDHQTLREDTCFQTAVSRERLLASPPTLSRFENALDRESMFKMSELLVEHFIERHAVAPSELILDFDPTDQAYCLRGDMENKIKQHKLDLSSDRNSCSDFLANQCRVLLSSIAYILMTELQYQGLSETELEKSYCGTIRLKLFKIGAIILKNTRRIKILFSSYYPYQNTFNIAAKNLVPT